jgi:hypothetical protein
MVLFVPHFFTTTVILVQDIPTDAHEQALVEVTNPGLKYEACIQRS